MRHVGAYEAKTHLPRLLEEVATGETITITKHGRPVAILAPARQSGPRAASAAAGLLEFRGAHRLGGLRIRELIDEGRKR